MARAGRPAPRPSAGETDMPPIRRSFRLPAALAAAAFAAALSGCGDSPLGPGTPLPPVSSVVIWSGGDSTVTADTLTVGANASFTAVIRDTAGAVLDAPAEWYSTNPQVFSVISRTGAVTARSEGEAYLVATAGGVSDSVHLLVLPATRGWFQQTSNSSGRLNGLFVQADGRAGCVVGDGGEILTTADAGGQWTRRTSNTAFNLHGVWFTSATVGFAVGNSGTILRTVNGGALWTLVPSGAGENLHDVTFPHPDTGFAVGAAGAILRTVDGGATWQKQNPTPSALHGVAFSTPREGWAVGDNGTIAGTTDGGVTWAVLTPAITSQNLRAAAARGRFLNWAAGDQGVTPRTVNNAGAVEWELRNAGAANALDGVFFATDVTGFACGTNGTGIVLRSDDGGASWTAQTVPNGTPLNDVFFVDALRGWAVGDNGRILHTVTGGAD